MARRRRRRSIIPALILFLLSLIVLGGTVLLIWKAGLLAKSVKIEGSFVSETELSDEAAAAACLWLSGAQDYDLDAAEIREKMGSIPVTVCLTLHCTEKDGGNFSREIDSASYDAAYNRAYDVLAQIMVDIIANQYEETPGNEEGKKADPEAINRAILETYNKPMAEYLKECDIHLIPTYDELAALYEATGQYRLEDDLLTLGNEQSAYVIKGNMLVLSGMEPSVYTREVTE